MAEASLPRLLNLTKAVAFNYVKLIEVIEPTAFATEM